MGYEVTVVVRCDGRTGGVVCTNDVRLHRSNKGGLNKTVAGMVARDEHGWQVRGGDGPSTDPSTAFCPDHRPR
jgi:hypothetical protein